MATAVTVSGGPLAVLTIVSTRKARHFDAQDVAFLAVIADWTGLGLENALRRQLQPRASILPPAAADAPKERAAHRLAGRR
jgi:GAF domain-containing protein